MFTTFLHQQDNHCLSVDVLKIGVLHMYVGAVHHVQTQQYLVLHSSSPDSSPSSHTQNTELRFFPDALVNLEQFIIKVHIFVKYHCCNRTWVLKQMLWTFITGEYGHEFHTITVLEFTWYCIKPMSEKFCQDSYCWERLLYWQIAANYLILEFHYRIFRTMNA